MSRLSIRTRVRLVALTATVWAGLLSAGNVQAAGEVCVNFVDAERFADIGRWSVDRDHNLQALSGIFRSLGRQLRNGQTLQLDVLDVDLAGEVELAGLRELRIVRGRADWPRMTLRYTLKQGDRTLKSGESNLSDMAYTFGANLVRDDEPLKYERRMVEEWFKRTVLDQTTAASH